MFIAPQMMLDLAKAHRNDQLEEAKISRLLRQARVARPRFQERLLVSVGRLLISAGKKLQGEYETVTLHDSEAYPSGC